MIILFISDNTEGKRNDIMSENVNAIEFLTEKLMINNKKILKNTNKIGWEI